ncbi:hypothetical protein C8R47DRAFT_1000144 [Mycena vitilis]|nr:hypothetical protein C8R47DRAFT_1000144 [Mycena vitilis]
MIHGAAPINRDEHRSSIPLSSLTHLLSTNNSPSDVEISLIRDSVSDGSLRITALNAQIDALSALLARLIVERDGMAEKLQKYSVVLAPARRIPAELVCEIFSWTLVDKRGVDDDKADSVPWYLGHVCRSWRHTAAGFPLLWRAVSVYHSEVHRHQPLDMLHTQLARSANTLLDINVGWWAEEIGDALPLLDALLPHSNRWNSLRLGCSASSFALLLPSFLPVKGQLAQLKSLHFDVGGWEPAAPRMSPDFFSIAPCLREVFLISPDFHEYSPTPFLPWQQITHYRAFLPVAELFDVFRTVPNLVEATLQTDDETEGRMDVTPLALPHLRRLHVEDGGVLTQITAPMLNYLSSHIIDYIPLFLLRSSCQLTTLVLAASMANPVFAVPSEDVISLLRNIPTLRNLLLQANFEEYDDENNENNDEVLRAMTLSGSADDLCPKLDHFAYGSTMTEGEEDPFSPYLFVAMIRSRLHPDAGHSLSSAKLFSALGRQYSPAVAQIAPLIHQGFDVSFVEDWRALLSSASTALAFDR